MVSAMLGYNFLCSQILFRLKASMLGVMRLLEYVREKDTTTGCDDTLMISSALRYEILAKEQYCVLIQKYQRFTQVN